LRVENIQPMSIYNPAVTNVEYYESNDESLMNYFCGEKTLINTV